MMTFVFTFILLAIVISVMAVGVIFQNKPIKGSCGGLAALGMSSGCEICGGDRMKCDEENASVNSTSKEDKQVAEFYDASKS